MLNHEKNNEIQFTVERLNIIRDIEKHHFWFSGRIKFVRWLFVNYVDLPVNKLLDLGCGTGHNLKYWLDYGTEIIGMDRLVSTSTCQDKNEKNITTLVGCVYSVPLTTESIDVVVSLDVLEHVPDSETVKEIYRILVPEGMTIITVPAMPWLWSERDRVAGHLRRYTPEILIRIFEENGFTIEYINYYQCLLFPLFWAARIFGRKNKTVISIEEKPLNIVNSFFGFLTKIELLLIRNNLTLPWGSSLVLVAKKA